MSAPSIAWLREQGLAVYDDAERCGRALAARAFLGRAARRRRVAGVAAVAAARAVRRHAAGERGDGAAGRRRRAGARHVADAPIRRARPRPRNRSPARSRSRRPPGICCTAPTPAAVVLGVSSGAEAAAAHTRVVEAARAVGATPEGSVVQQMSPAGVELIVGARRDPEFGPVLVVGMGGVTAEIQADVARRLLPLREGEALAMLQELRTFALLDGLPRCARRRRRGRRPGDRWDRPAGGGARRRSGGDRGQPTDRRPGRRGRGRRADHPRRDGVSTGLIASSRSSLMIGGHVAGDRDDDVLRAALLDEPLQQRPQLVGTERDVIGHREVRATGQQCASLGRQLVLGRAGEQRRAVVVLIDRAPGLAPPRRGSRRSSRRTRSAPGTSRSSRPPAVRPGQAPSARCRRATARACA